MTTAHPTATREVWPWFLAAGVAASAAYFLLPAVPVAQSLLFTAIHLSVIPAILYGTRRHRPGARRIWYLLAAGQCLSVTGNVLWYVLPVATGAEDFSALTHTVFLTSYAILLTGLGLLLRARTQGRDRAGLIDAAMVTLGVGWLPWRVLVAPTVLGAETPSAQVVTIAYPLVDALLLAFLVRLLFAPGRRSPAFWLLATGIVGQLFADAAFSTGWMAGTSPFGGPAFAGWLTFYVLFGTAALHPSMAGFSDPQRVTRRAGTTRRLIGLGGAVLIPVLVEGVRAAVEGDVRSAIAFAVLMALLVLAMVRLYWLTVDLAERQRMERIKNEFVSVVSHELRTPLTAIHGALGLLAGGVYGPLPEQGQRMLDIASANTERLVRLINDILDMERMESGEVALAPAAVPAGGLLQHAADALRPMAEEAGVALVVEPPGAHVRVWADEDRIAQTLQNLLSNAIKFSPAGATVTLAAAPLAGQVRFTVRDQGRGIPPDQLDSVFGRFQQVDASDSRDKGGTGLGLAICRAIVVQHGGTIHAESTLGEGATFVFTLPAAPAPAPAPDTADDARPRVLVCDDDAAARSVVHAILEDRGFAVTVAGSGSETLRLAAADRPDAIVLDLMMPDMDGWETAEALRACPDTRDIPVVVLSVLRPADTDRPAPQARSWLTKPADPELLAAALRRTVEQRPDPPTVLLVEDDAGLADILTVFFDRHGWETVQVGSGAAALHACRHREPDLLILDLGLPEGDGFAVVDQLRHHDRLRSVPLMVYTARDLSAADRERLRLGETRFFTKSQVSPEAFDAHVTALLRRLTERREEPAHAVP